MACPTSSMASTIWACLTANMTTFELATSIRSDVNGWTMLAALNSIQTICLQVFQWMIAGELGWDHCNLSELKSTLRTQQVKTWQCNPGLPRIFTQHQGNDGTHRVQHLGRFVAHPFFSLQGGLMSQSLDLILEAGLDRLTVQKEKTDWNDAIDEPTYPLTRHFWRWFSFSPGGICWFPGG